MDDNFNQSKVPYTFIYVWESEVHGIRKSLSPGAWNGMLPTKTIPVWTKPVYDSTANQSDPFYSGLIEGEQDWQILKTAVETWGEYEQVMMAIGECGEFLTLMGRKVQGRLVESDMHDEIADVLIMMHQMANIYGIDHVRARVRHKMKKLSAKLDKYKQELAKKDDI